MLEVPRNSVESYLPRTNCQLWHIQLVGYTRVPTYSYELRELASRRVRHELVRHDRNRWGDSASGKIGGECVEAHGE